MRTFVVGAGGLGREALDAALAAGVTIDAFIDDDTSRGTVRGLPVVQPDDAPAGGSYVIGIAAPQPRARLAELLEARGLQPVTVVHPRAVIAPETTLDMGCLVLAQAHVSSSVRIGRHVQVHYNATVGHDAVIGDFAAVFPGANVSGAVQLGAGVTVGSNAVVLQGRTVGAGAIVGAGAVVTRDVAPGTVVVGNPARELRRRG